MHPLRAAGRAGGLLAIVAFATPATAHSGTTHAGTPHWLLFALAFAGVGAAVVAMAAYRRGRVDGPTGAAAGLVAAVAGGFGLVGLVELQVVADTGPQIRSIYPALSLAVGAAMAVGSLVVARSRWPRRPRYAALGVLLAAWVVYPVAMPNGGTYHPLGYVLVASVTFAVGYVLYRDAWGVVQSLRRDRRPLGAGLAAGALFVCFFAFSAGTITLNPDAGVGAPTESLVVFLPVADPLVAWPAVEFVFPSIPLAGFVSVGTVLLMGLLGSLVAVNVGVLVQQSRAGSADGSTSALGMVATTGATACCCCAPAFYGVLSVVFGAAATPAYWAFLDPTSPVGGVFFAASVLLLLGNIVRATGGGQSVGA
ncbi:MULTISPECIES: hypothetical protein [Halobacterium]|uniref:hypothetical protein n=1 Tax=Halobacterium TaxID=2239 RepID=UPI00073EDD9E|nr:MULTISPECIES: hypothetical protein [Halobacterium]MCG1002593.1 hypothetical protein [Halobacterium noricense]